MKTDTIAAISTAVSDSGIGIVRISGKDAIDICDKIFVDGKHRQKLKEYESHTVHYGFIKNGEQIVDEVMLLIMKAPRSYTTEDTVEINCHGGVLMVQNILQIVLDHGARIAEPGEFTKRAFLNGRIDLSEAEAVMDVIHAKSELSLRNSVRQLKGSVSKKIKELREDILYEIAFIESALDDPEHISLDGYPEKLSSKCESIKKELDQLIKGASYGKIINEGINTVIVGKPNAGKSSILNAIIGEDRAIVTDIEGTTRDALTESVRFGNVSLNIIDTAGIRNTDDVIEQIGVGKAIDYAKQADLIFYVADRSVKLNENDQSIVEMLSDKKTIILLNKNDLDAVITEDDLAGLFKKNDEITSAERSNSKDEYYFEESQYDHVKKLHQKDVYLISTSAKKEDGIVLLEDLVEKMFFSGSVTSDEDLIITNMRHKEHIQNAFDSIGLVLHSIEMMMPEDFYSIDLMSAYSSLGMVIGEEVGDDLVNEIFSKFCMGK